MVAVNGGKFFVWIFLREPSWTTAVTLKRLRSALVTNVAGGIGGIGRWLAMIQSSSVGAFKAVTGTPLPAPSKELPGTKQALLRDHPPAKRVSPKIFCPAGQVAVTPFRTG